LRIRELNLKLQVGYLPVLQSHRTLLLQIFQNLIDNALKYHSQVPEITIAASCADEQWTFMVKDNGIGVAPEDQTRIFGFLQRGQTESYYGGTGMGLAICRRAVELCRGKIWVESEGKGRGSVFFFTLPVALHKYRLTSSRST
jgi:two-component system, chemotaxis family, sensor kinase Cph1